MELVEAVFYKKINPGDLLNIDHALHKGGGGQTYLDLAGISEDDLCDFLSYGNEIERQNPPLGDHRKKFGIYAYALGTEENKLIEFDPRNNRPNYKLSDQRTNRHPAWTKKYGFPESPPNARFAKDVTNVDNLVVYIIRTSKRRYFAGFINVENKPYEWPSGIGLENLFDGNRKGILFLKHTMVAFKNDAIKPFVLVSTKKIEDLEEIPDEITHRPEDAIEFIEDEIKIPDFKDWNYFQNDIPLKMKTFERKSKKRVGKKVDYIRSQKNKSAIGRAGEIAVVDYEKQRLRNLGRTDLADMVEWVSDTQGDGLGYDIKSFDIIDNVVCEIYIEVKTTTGDITKPFEISLNEVEFSEENSSQFILFRIFEFSLSSNDIHFYKVKGSIKNNFNLISTNYIASI